MLAAAILAAGESRRMGSPKALLPYRGKTFLAHLLDVTTHPRIGVTRVVVGAHAGSISKAVAFASGELVINPDWEQGQLSSILAALRSLPPVTEGLLVCPVDQPAISAALVSQLIAVFDATRKLIVLPTWRGKRGHPVIFSAKLYDELAAAPLETGARAVVWAHPGDIAEVHTKEEGVILNLNDPEAVKRLEAET